MNKALKDSEIPITMFIHCVQELTVPQKSGNESEADFLLDWFTNHKGYLKPIIKVHFRQGFFGNFNLKLQELLRL